MSRPSHRSEGKTRTLIHLRPRSKLLTTVPSCLPPASCCSVVWPLISPSSLWASVSPSLQWVSSRDSVSLWDTPTSDPRRWLDPPGSACLGTLLTAGGWDRARLGAGPHTHTGCVHCRSELCTPTPQVRVQMDQELQPDQPPSTASGWESTGTHTPFRHHCQDTWR